MTWLFNPPSGFVDYLFPRSKKHSAKRVSRRDLIELTPSPTMAHSLRRAMDRRSAINEFLSDVLGEGEPAPAPATEFLENPNGGLSDGFPIEEEGGSSGQAARLLMQRGSAPLLLADRLTDAVVVWARQTGASLENTTIRVDAALDQAHVNMTSDEHRVLRHQLSIIDEVLEEGALVDRFFYLDPFPCRVVVETEDGALVGFLREESLHDWLGIGIDIGPPGKSVRPNFHCTYGARGRIGGFIKVRQLKTNKEIAELMVTCAHVVGKCPATVLRGNVPERDWTGRVIHTPDVALIDRANCSCDARLDTDPNEPISLIWPYRAEDAAIAHMPARYLGYRQRSDRGYVLAPHTFWTVGSSWYRCPAIELLASHSLLERIFHPRRRGFSSPGDSGSWIGHSDRPGQWLGMITADRPETHSSFAIEARFLAEYFGLELSQLYRSRVRIEARG